MSVLRALPLIRPSDACSLKAEHTETTADGPAALTQRGAGRRGREPLGARRSAGNAGVPSWLPGRGGGAAGLPSPLLEPHPNTCVLEPHPLPMALGKLVIKDHEETIVLRTRHILIDNGGELHAGSALCPYQGNFSIVLYGRWADSFWGAGWGGQMLLSDLMRRRLSKGERQARWQGFSARRESSL